MRDWKEEWKHFGHEVEAPGLKPVIKADFYAVSKNAIIIRIH